MNREIKFRIWDNNRFEEISLFQLLRYDNSDLDFNDNFKAQQFTGLQDKNGKDIYEGDIISYTPFNQKDYKNTVIKVLDLCKFHWWAELEEMSQMENSCDIKVIGNIFENPELLKTV